MPYDLVNDLKNGHKNEKVVLTFLNKNVYPTDRFKLYKDQFKRVDFRNKEIVGELKSRSCKYKEYQETFFGYNKLEFLIQSGDTRLWQFYFLFMDGLYVWNYNKDQYRVADHYHQEKGVVDQVYVNIKYLVKITHNINFMSWIPEDWEEFC